VTNFAQEAGLLVRSGACLQVPDGPHLAQAFSELARDPERRAAMARLALEAVQAQKGATRFTLEALTAVGLGAGPPGAHV
jgi:3-deoxy-D-manno-octulosonic-acid transferase